MRAAIKAIGRSISRDRADILGAFLAGGLYMAGLGGIAGGTVAFVAAVAPRLGDVIAPAKFPVYSADKLERMERLAPHRWSQPPETPVVQPAPQPTAVARQGWATGRFAALP